MAAASCPLRQKMPFAARMRAAAGPPGSFALLRALREAGERLLSSFVNLKELIELGDHEDFINLRIDVRQAKLAILAANPVIDGDQRSERGRGKVIHIVEADQNLGLGLGIDDLADFRADLLNIGFIEDVAVNELDARNVIVVRDAKS
jgi:hypothetical protein